MRYNKNMKHFANFAENQFLNNLKGSLVVYGGQTAGAAAGKAGGGLLANKLAEGREFNTKEDKEDYVDNISSGAGYVGGTLGSLGAIHALDKNFIPNRWQNTKDAYQFIATGKGRFVDKSPIFRNGLLNVGTRLLAAGSVAGGLIGTAKGSGLWESKEERDKTRPFELSRDKNIEKAADPKTGEIPDDFQYTPSREEKINDGLITGGQIGTVAAGGTMLGLLAARPWTRSMYYKYNRRNYKPMPNQQKAIAPNVPQLNPTIPNWRMK